MYVLQHARWLLAIGMLIVVSWEQYNWRQFQLRPKLLSMENYVLLIFILFYTVQFLLYKLGLDKRACGLPDVKWLSLYMNICSIRGTINVLTFIKMFWFLEKTNIVDNYLATRLVCMSEHIQARWARCRLRRRVIR